MAGLLDEHKYERVSDQSTGNLPCEPCDDRKPKNFWQKLFDTNNACDPVGLHHFQTPILGHRIFALRSCNSPTPILLVHGAIASRRYMIPTAKLLAPNYQVLLPDLPGHGASSKPEHALTVQEQARVLKEWIMALGVPRVNVIANSYGCQIAAQLAVSHPNVVHRLILTDPTGDPSAPTMWQQLIRLALDGFVEPFGAPLMMFKDIYDMGIRRTLETGHRIKEDDIKKNLPNVRAKTLVVRGEKDPIAPQKWCEQVTGMLPDARLVVIPKAPHSINAANARELTQIVESFLAEPD
jgi:2-hydroxy-6-oxonona-2,4-dienedioate hydrolase